MAVTLYYMPIACSLVPLIALNEANAAFEVEVVDFRRQAHLSPEFLRLNPKHKVPVLVIDGSPLTENVAILQWIAQAYPAAMLLPRADLDRFRAISLMAWCASGIHPHLTPNALPARYCDLPGSEESVRRCAQKLLHENYAIAEGLLNEREYFFDHFTAPDAYFFWTFRRGGQFDVDQTAYPACRAHFDRVSERPSVQKALAFEAETLTRLAAQ